MGEQQKITAMQQIVSSTSGAVLTSLFVTPLDVVKIRLQKQVRLKWSGKRLKHNATPLDVAKVRLQAQSRPLVPGRCFLYYNGLMDHLCTCASASTSNCEWYQRPPRPAQFTGTWDAMKGIARTEGLASLWSGLSPTLVMAIPATVCYFTVYDNLHLWLRKRFHWESAAPITAGITARGLVVTAISPLELVRTKAQSEKMSYQEILQAVRLTVSELGILSLWRGVGPTILRDVPFSGIYWGLYEALKSRLIQMCRLDSTNFSISFTSGAIAGSVAAFVTVPFDVIKTHRQIEIGESMAIQGKNGSTETSTRALLTKLYQQQGIRSIFAGAVPRVIKIAPACAIMIGTYEYGKLFFNQRNSHHFR